MDFYPSEFSPEARDRIEREKIRAYRKLLPSSVYDSREQESAIRCIMGIFLAFAKEACALRKERGWTIERVERESNEFRRRLTIKVFSDKFPGLDRYRISSRPNQLSLDDVLKAPSAPELLNRYLQTLGLIGPIDSDVERRFRESVEWKEYEELLLATPLAATTTGGNHCAEVKAYRAEVLQKTGKKITKKAIWERAGYKSRTEFERWERQDAKHPNAAADEAFTKILRDKPHLK
jgi:hypothetical protein